MGKKKPKKRNAGPPKPMIRLSQCMIVKNEEKNIERALGWAKSIAFERIVVDTGSTDRTVELAEKMGATVHHFAWIDDFAAAKNFAIEKATGNWIAFLDADEYFTAEDAKAVVPLLKQIHSEPKLREEFLAINCPWVQLDDQGKPFGIDEQVRLFRNVPSVRYVGKIHEKLSLEVANVVRAENISIMHTGYSRAAYTETDKAERNVDMLRGELAVRPDDLNLKVYLADALRGKAREDGPEKGAASEAEAEALYAEVAGSAGQVDPMLNKKAHTYTVEKHIVSGGNLWESERLCERALAVFPGDMDFEYYLARIMNQKGNYQKARELLETCEVKLADASAIFKSDLLPVKPMLMYEEMLYASQGLGDTVGIIKYATMVLMEDKTNQEILSPYIATLLNNGTPEDEVIGLFGKMYDMSDPNDLLVIARAAKDCGAIDFARRIAGMATQFVKQ